MSEAKITINGTVNGINYNELRELERKAEAYDKLDPENAAVGVNIAMMARDIFAIESQDNGYGVVGLDQNKLHDFIKLITGVKPVDVNVYYDNNGVRMSVKI